MSAYSPNTTPDRDSAEVVRRPPRYIPPPITGEIDLPAPPTLSPPPPPNLLPALLSAFGIVLLGMLYALLGGANSGLLAVTSLVLGGLALLVALLSYHLQQRYNRQMANRAREDYHRLLERRTVRLQALREAQQARNQTLYPPPQVVISLVSMPEPTVWQRRPNDPDFLHLRLGCGTLPSSVSIRAPDPDLLSEDQQRVQAIFSEYSDLPNVGVPLDIRAIGSFGIVGEPQHTYPFLYWLIAQSAFFHAPSDLSIYLFSSRARYAAWSWLRWLPHTSQSRRGGFPDYLSFTPDDSRAVLSGLAARLESATSADTGAILVIFEEVTAIQDEMAYQTLLNSRQVISVRLANDVGDIPSEYAGIIRLNDSQFTGHVGAQVLQGQSEWLSYPQADFLARRLANLILPELGEVGRLPNVLNLLEVYEADHVQSLALISNWQRPVPFSGVLPFPVPIGKASFSNTLYLDLSEQAHGAHGMIAGTTGAGKSELLQTIVAALAIEHHPYLLSLLLIDYKGGATFNAFRHLPHVSGMITNLDAREALRALSAIKAENQRRQQFLAEQGVEDITEYHKRLRRTNGKFPDDWQPLPHLVIIVDEFAALTDELPDFLDELVGVARLGRSLGLHLVLATQRPAGQVTPEMSANLNFRISLRVQSPEESREVIRRPDAAFLPPNTPGRAYFTVGNTFTQFQVARVGNEYTQRDQTSQDRSPLILKLVQFERPIDLIPPQRADQTSERDAAPVLLGEALVQHISAVAAAENIPKAAPVLRPSLSDLTALSDLADFGGWDGQSWQPRAESLGWASVPIGVLDDLGNQAQPPLLIHFNAGHFLAAGMPASGKTALIRSLTVSLARHYRPDEAEIYLLSFSGRGLDHLAALPQVGAVIGADERERLMRLIRRLLVTLDERRYLLAAVNADDLEMYHRRKSAEMPPLAALFVLIDNFTEVYRVLEDDFPELLRLLRDGRAVGIHFALTAPTINLPYQVLNLIEARFALRLPDRAAYTQFLGRAPDRGVDPRPGSGVLGGNPLLHGQIALPERGLTDDARDTALAATIQAMRAAWGERPTPKPIQTLPETILFSEAFAHEGQPSRLPQTEDYESPVGVVGIDGDSLQPTAIHLRDTPHLLIAGGFGAGKSSVLRTLLLGIAARYAPSELHLILLDLEGESLRSLRHLPHVVAYVNDPILLGDTAARLRAELAYRRGMLSAQNSEEDDLHDGMPFRPLVVAVDDYDLLSDALTSSNYALLEEIAAWLRRDRRSGLHFVATCDSGVLARGGDPILRALRSARNGIALDLDSVDALGGRVGIAARREALPVGRGYLIRRSTARLTQFAYSPEPHRLARAIAAQWRNFPSAAWSPREVVPPPSEISRPTSSWLDFSFDLDGAIEDYKDQQGYT